MFENLIKELENLNGTSVSVPIEADSDGFIDKECPNPKCLFQFKVNNSDWKIIFRDEEVFCPLCGKASLAKTFFTSEQVEAAKDRAINLISAQMGNALRNDAQTFNNKQSRNSFIKISLEVKGFHNSETILPISAKDKIERKVTCSKCNAQYAVVGSAYFCPSCGYNDIEKTFDQSMQTILFKIENATKIKQLLLSIDKDQAVNTERDLLESSVGDLVTAFQRFCEHKYISHPSAKTIKPNTFQRIVDGGQLWKDLLNQTYTDWLTPPEYSFLFLMFQRRHLLEHQQGIIDAKYLKESSDSNYQVGERLMINESDLSRFYKLILKIIQNLKQI